MNRLFSGSPSRCLNIAVDHGCFNEPSFLPGIEDFPPLIKALVAGEPDAIQLGPGQAYQLQSLPGRHKPALVLRVDVTNAYGAVLPDTLYDRMIDSPVDQALSLDAACVIMNLFSIPGRPDIADQCLQNIINIKPACDRYGMPLMVESLVLKPGNEPGVYVGDGDVNKIMPLVRQAVELGVDVIKADPTTDLTDFHRVVRVACGAPVLIRGGGKTDDLQVLRRTAQLMQQGMAGVVYGRNIYQHQDPTGMTRALMAVVHDNTPAAQAAKLIGKKSTKA